MTWEFRENPMYPDDGRWGWIEPIMTNDDPLIDGDIARMIVEQHNHEIASIKARLADLAQEII